jgi:glycosyltransferase involved in cell wall biosynthesis
MDKSRRVAHQVHTDGKAIWEFPYATLDLGLVQLPISGGNYIRQIPFTLMRHAIRSWHRQAEQPFMFYFHVWELDPEQPRISAASRLNRVRHYRKLDKMEWILNENLAAYDCTSVADHLGLKQEIEVESPENAIDFTQAKKQSRRQRTNTPITIVIPCYNEKESLSYLANTLRSVEQDLNDNGYAPNVIFVDDKSKDGTLRLLNELFGKHKNVRIIEHETNMGVAAGIMTGIGAADTEIVCSMDCDCTYDPHELVKMLPLMNDGVDLVTASPYHRDGGVRNVPSWRLFLSRGASFLYRRVLRSKLDTYTSCFRVYRKNAFIDLELTENGFLGVAEMLGRVDLAGGTIVEFPAVLEVRLFGFSKMKTAKTIVGHLKLLSRLVISRFFGKSTMIKPSLTKKKLVASENRLD